MAMRELSQHNDWHLVLKNNELAKQHLVKMTTLQSFGKSVCLTLSSEGLNTLLIKSPG